jgi:hypothetical protein
MSYRQVLCALTIAAFASVLAAPMAAAHPTIDPKDPAPMLRLVGAATTTTTPAAPMTSWTKRKRLRGLPPGPSHFAQATASVSPSRAR